VGEELLEPQAAMKRAEESGRAARRARTVMEGSILETILRRKGFCCRRLGRPRPEFLTNVARTRGLGNG
jgi:hypothetical protein